MKKYLGIDLGSKSLGLSISSSGIIANAYKTKYFTENNYNEAIKIIEEIVLEEKIDIIVIGLPRHMHNELGERAKISIDFANKLKEKTNKEVALWDERTSTKSALKAMIDQNLSRKKQKLKKDEVAATIILQNYLDYKENELK